MALRLSSTDSSIKQEVESNDGSVLRDIPSLRRRVAQMTLAAGSATPKSESVPPVIPQLRRSFTRREETPDAASTDARHAERHRAYVPMSAIQLLFWPLSFILFLWVIAILSHTHHPLCPVFVPLCYIPGISRPAFCIPQTSLPTPPAPLCTDYRPLINAQSSALEKLLDSSGFLFDLTNHIKTSEVAAANFTSLVRVSDLRSRDLIVKTLGELIKDAHKMNRELHSFGAKIGSAVDAILAVNNRALYTIEGHLAPPTRFAFIFAFIPKASVQELVTKTFSETTGDLIASLVQLTVQLPTFYGHLHALMARLESLDANLMREGAALSAADGELLRGLGDYSKRSLVQFVVALTTLNLMSEDMEHLGQLVASPEIVLPTILAADYIRDFRSGLQRLKEARLKAKEQEEKAMRKFVLGLI
ncbi:hypothetical protein HWV62_31243 [Athelia sp. TMB]|nr:hypothetical protein HWV62_31243 [Athelia sp. TMB]